MKSTSVLSADDMSKRSDFVQTWPIAFLCIILVALPAAFALMTFQPEFEYSAIRQFSLPVLAAQALIIVGAIQSGFKLGPALQKMSKPARLAASILALVAFSTMLMASIDPQRAQILFSITAIQGFFALVCWERFNSDWRHARGWMINSTIVGLIGYVVIALALAWSVYGRDDFAWRQFGAGVSHVRQVGFYGVVLAGLSTGLLAAAQSERARKLACAALLLGFFLSDWSGARSAFGATIIGVAVVMLFAKEQDRPAFLKATVALFFVAMPLSMLAAPHELYGAKRIILSMFGIDSGLDAQAYSSGRLQIWTETFGKFLERPFFGWGEGQFRHGLVSLSGKYNHPHNSILQFLYQWGLVGSGALGALIYCGIRNVREAAKHEPAVALPAIGALSGLAAMSLLEGSFYHPLPIMFSLLSLALITSSVPEKTKNVRASAPTGQKT